jgi:hypothetical protein
MNEPIRPSVTRAWLAAIALGLVLTVGACSAGAAPFPSTGATPPPGSYIPATGGPTEPAAVSPETPVSTEPGGTDGGGGDGLGKPKVVVPQPGATNVHPVAIERIVAKIDGRHVKLNAIWWSGIEPCTVLDSTAFKIDGSTITVSVREGTGDGDVACIEIAVQKLTVIDLGELDPGSYTIVADKGDAPPLDITVR